MQKNNKALILVNTGTPEKPEVKSVRRFLSEFLNDKYVIDIPWLLRKFLVNMIIVPFRAPKSTELYQKLWTINGSPLLIHLNDLVRKTQKAVDSEFDVYGAMRYGKPSLTSTLKKVKNSYEDIIILPLFPQYASSTTGSIEYLAGKILGKNPQSKFNIIKQFYDHPAFIKTFANQIKKYKPESYDAIVFSYHGLPLRQINKIHPHKKEKNCECTTRIPTKGRFCYKATCYETTRLLIKELNVQHEKCHTTFQSRLSKNWLKPFTDESLKELAVKGNKNILLVAPSFVADCLETTIELGVEYKNQLTRFKNVRIKVVESLNSLDGWVNAVAEIVNRQSK